MMNIRVGLLPFRESKLRPGMAGHYRTITQSMSSLLASSPLDRSEKGKRPARLQWCLER